MYYVVKSVSDAKLIHKKHPEVDLEKIKRLIGYGLERYSPSAAIYVSYEGEVEYCTLSYYKEKEHIYGPQGKLTRTIKY